MPYYETEYETAEDIQRRQHERSARYRAYGIAPERGYDNPNAYYGCGLIAEEPIELFRYAVPASLPLCPHCGEAAAMHSFIDPVKQTWSP